MKILLIAGGWSTEREVSLTGGRVMEKALKSLGHEVTFCDLLENFDRILDLAGKHDFAMLNLHGTPGEDGLVQAMLESVHCPYLGAGPTVMYADKRARHDQFVTLEERFEDLLVRYGDTEEHRQGIRQSYAQGKAIERSMSLILGRDLSRENLG